MRKNLLQIFEEAYRDLRPDASIPELTVEFFAFTSIKNTVRMRQGRLLVRLSDLLEGAPEPVLRAIAHILLAKMYRRPVEREAATSTAVTFPATTSARRPTWCAKCADESISTRPRAVVMTWKLYLKTSIRGFSMACWLAR